MRCVLPLLVCSVSFFFPAAGDPDPLWLHEESVQAYCSETLLSLSKDHGAWLELLPQGELPPGRVAHTAIYDTLRRRMVIFGGMGNATRARLNDVWVLSLSPSPTWVQLHPSGTPPTPRYNHPAVHDPVRDRMVVFGGHDGAPLADVWALSLMDSPTWTLLHPEGPQPTTRTAHTAIYDPHGDRMIVFGGSHNGTRLNDTWALTLSDPPTWTQLPLQDPLPSARYHHEAVYDQRGGRMIVFGGWDGSHLSDVWALTLVGAPTWTQLLPSGPAPSGRTGPTAVYDSNEDRLVIFGGGNANVPELNDTWALGLSPNPTWTQLLPTGEPPLERGASAAIYHPENHRMLVFGGSTAYYLNDTWALQWDAPTVIPALIDIEPDVLNLKSSGRWITCYIELPQGQYVGDIDVSSIRLNECVPAEPWPYTVGNYDGDDLLDLMVKFNREVVGGLLDPGEAEIRITGTVDEEEFAGADTITVISPGRPEKETPGSRVVATTAPNPFHGSTEIGYKLSEDALVELLIFDVSGRKVRTLQVGLQGAGEWSVRWDGTDDFGGRVPPGIHFCRLRVGERESSRKLILLRR